MKKIFLEKISTILDNLSAGWIFLTVTSLPLQQIQDLIISIILAILCLGSSISITFLLKEDYD